MAFVDSEALRNDIAMARANKYNAGKLVLLNGTQPAFGGADTTRLVVINLPATFDSAAANGVIESVDVQGTGLVDSTATWGYFEDSSGNRVTQGDVGVLASSALIKVDSTAIKVGSTVTITTPRFTVGNG